MRFTSIKRSSLNASVLQDAQVPQSEKKERPFRYSATKDFKEFRKKKHHEVIKRFIDEDCEYDYQHIMDVDLMKKAYTSFLRRHSDEYSNLNISLGLAASDIPAVDDRFQYIWVRFCNFCKHKHHRNCCDDHEQRESTKIKQIINMRLRAGARTVEEEILRSLPLGVKNINSSIREETEVDSECESE